MLLYPCSEAFNSEAKQGLSQWKKQLAVARGIIRLQKQNYIFLCTLWLLKPFILDWTVANSLPFGHVARSLVSKPESQQPPSGIWWFIKWVLLIPMEVSLLQKLFLFSILPPEKSWPSWVTWSAAWRQTSIRRSMASLAQAGTAWTHYFKVILVLMFLHRSAMQVSWSVFVTQKH